MSGLTHYVFRSVWHVDARPADVVPVLYDIESYPAWWPEIRHVRALGEQRFDVVARSFLPYELRFVGEGAEPRTSEGIVEATLSGDMRGSMRWTVREVAEGCRIVYDQEVTTNKRLLNALAPVARPGFKANHAAMMRHGEAGLRTYIAGYLRGVSRSGDG